MQTYEILQQELLNLNNLLSEKDNEISYLNGRIKLLTDYIFGKKSERIIKDNPDQPGLFDGFNLEEKKETEPKEEDFETIGEYTRLKKGRKPVPADLPCREVIHKLSAEEKKCACCGQEMTLIGYDESKEVDLIPARVEAILNKREKYACKNKNCERDTGVSPIAAEF